MRAACVVLAAVCASALVPASRRVAAKPGTALGMLGYKAQIEELRKVYGESLVEQHGARLEVEKKHAAAMKVAAAREAALSDELKATQDAFATQLSKSHDAKLAMQKEHEAALRSSYEELKRSEALLAETRQAFTDYMAKKQIEMTDRTVALEKKLEASDAELEKVRDDFQELATTLNTHVEETDDLIERQGDQIRKQREALASVAALASGAVTKD